MTTHALADEDDTKTTRRQQGLTMHTATTPRALLLTLLACLLIASLAGPGRAASDDTPTPAPNPAPTPSPAAAPSDADPVVDAMQRYYNEVKAYSATFEQALTEITGVQSAPARGTVWFMKPGLMRWDYEAPDEKYMISDGKTFWIWEPNLQQYCKQDLGSSQLPTALTFLSGEGDIRKEFNVSLKPSKSAGEQRLKLTPKKPSSSYAEIEFVIDAASSQVKRALITDALGNINNLTFSDPEVNDAIGDADPAHFTFSPPAGATDICAQLKR